MHGRDNTNRFWPDLVSADDDFHIADEMHRITKLTDFGWPYTYFDGAKNVRLISPEYGGDGKKSPPSGAPTVFADGFAAFNQSATAPGPARYRPIGIAEGPDGSLYVADSQKGRIWRIAYEKEGSRTTA